MKRSLIKSKVENWTWRIWTSISTRPVLAFHDTGHDASPACISPLLPKVVCDHSQPHHDHLLPWQLSHRTNRPPLPLSIFFFLSLTLSLFIVFVVTPPHPSVTAITHFNSSSDESFYLIYSFFCLSLRLCFIKLLQQTQTQQLSVLLHQYQHLAANPFQRGQSSLMGGGVLTSMPLAQSSLYSPHMQYVLRSETSKFSGEPQWQELEAEGVRSLGVGGAAVWGGFLTWPVLGLHVLSVKICNFQAQLFCVMGWGTDVHDWNSLNVQVGHLQDEQLVRQHRLPVPVGTASKWICKTWK